jgi:hypothetical protein
MVFEVTVTVLVLFTGIGSRGVYNEVYPEEAKSVGGPPFVIVGVAVALLRVRGEVSIVVDADIMISVTEDPLNLREYGKPGGLEEFKILGNLECAGGWSCLRLVYLKHPLCERTTK